MTTYWTQGNRPEHHPQWAEQVLLERTMLTTGADQYRATVNKAREKGAMDSLKPYRRIADDMLPAVCEAIQQWRKAAAVARGPKQIAHKRTLGIPGDLLARVTLRAALNRLATGSANHTAVALEVGTYVEHEARLIAWQERDHALFQEMERSLRDPEQPNIRVGASEVRSALRDGGVLTLAAVKQRLKEQKATSVHQRRVVVNRFNKEVRDKGQWDAWSHDDKLHVGNRLLGLLETSTGRFKREISPVRPAPGKKRPYVYKMDEELRQWLANGLERQELLHPFFMPTIIPPRDWTSLSEGGYHTNLLPQRLMIRFKADHEEQRRRAVEDMSSVAMPLVYEALNAAQSVPWRINEAVFAVAFVAWANDLQLGKMPRKGQHQKPHRASIVDEDTPEGKAALRVHKRALRDWHGDNARLAGKKFRTDRLLDVAERFLEQERIYFPHVLDFRGRMYPIPVDLNPQGEDLARGLLTFAEGKVVDEAASKWLAIQVANTFGNDKVSFDERVQWTLERQELWRRIAADPMANREWATVSGTEKVADPWQHLAAVLEWVRYLDRNPKEDFVSSLPIRLDGTCNGIQHLSALIRDEEGGASVNLLPSSKPNDIYREAGELIGAELRRLVARDETELSDEREITKHDNALFCLGALGDGVPRSLAKQAVMTFPYGSKREGVRRSIIAWMDKEDPNGDDFPEDRRDALAGFLAEVMLGVVSQMLTKAASVQRWLEAVARLTADQCGNAPLRWLTPTGFMVRQFYGVREERDLKSPYDSPVRKKMVIKDTTKELDRRKHIQSIAPNFTHAMDAAVLMEVLRWSQKSHLTEFTAIHDAFGTVAADVFLLHAGIRKAFVKMYADHDPLDDFLEACKDMVAAARGARNMDSEMEWPPRPKPGSLDVREVMNSYYFVA